MELFDYVLLALITGTLFYAYLIDTDVTSLRQDLKKLQHDHSFLTQRLESLQNEMLYQKLQPQIKEYMALKSYTKFSYSSYYDGHSISFYNDLGYVDRVDLNQVESRLAELKSVLEKNCPKRCKKAAKKS